MCSMIDSGEKGNKLPEQILFNSLVLYLTLVKQKTTLCTVKLFIQLMYNKNDHLAEWSIFVRCLMSLVFPTA